MTTRPSRIIADSRGVTIAEIVVALAIIGIAAAAAIPSVNQAMNSMNLNAGAREVVNALQTARLRAVATSRPLQVRFNCPVAQQYRMVEFTGVAAIDNDVSRCSPTKYPYPAPDQDPSTLPNLDGPIQLLPSGVTFFSTTTPQGANVQFVQFNSNGTMQLSSGGVLSTGTVNLVVQIQNSAVGFSKQTVVATPLGRVYVP